MSTTTTIPADAKTFADGVLRGIGAPVNSVTESGMYWWLANEQGGPNLTSFEANKGNPLGVMDNAGQTAGHTGDLQGGINATVGNLLAGSGPGGYYAGVVSAFRRGTSTMSIANAIVASPWNGNRYGGINTFLKTAGQPGGSATTFIPTGGAAPLTPAQTILSAASTPSGGCGAKVGSNPAIPNMAFTIPHTSSGLTYCNVKAIIGAMAMTAGGVVIVIGLSTLIIGGLASKGGGIGAPVFAAARVVTKTRTARKTLSPTKAAASEATEEAA
jgi:hypothetical protein